MRMPLLRERKRSSDVGVQVDGTSLSAQTWLIVETLYDIYPESCRQWMIAGPDRAHCNGITSDARYAVLSINERKFPRAGELLCSSGDARAGGEVSDERC